MKPIKSVVIAALALSAFGAMAGEIDNSTVYGYGADNRATGTYAYAYQGIGVATGDAKIQNAFIEGGYARNAATGSSSYASQEIGAASYGGKLNNVYVNGYGATNAATGSYSWATQEIGKAVGNGSVVHNSTVYAPFANNLSSGYGSGAQQKIGVAQ